MAIYVAVKYQQKAFGYWPYAGQEVETAKMLMRNAMDLLERVHKHGGKEE